MNKLISFTVMLLVFSLTKAQTVRYSYKPLAEEGCSVSYSIAQQDSLFYLFVTIKSDRFKFLNSPIMKLKTFNNSVLTLNGKSLGDGTTSAGIVIGNMVLPISELQTTAQFQITESQIEMLNEGISKVRITAIPINHERTFKKDKVGKKLYKLYLKKKKEVEDF